MIVARSYVGLLPYRDPDLSVADHIGHGTALAMVAAGARNAGPMATITGVAPKAYLGVYKVFGTPGYNDYASDDAILTAIDDAVKDGMDVINLSLGTDFAPRLADDLDAQAVERAATAGVIVVAAAGNNGPELNTMSSPATAPSAIAVGATSNDRTFATSVEVPGLAQYLAVASGGTAPGSPITASIADVSAADGDGLACTALPAGSMAGRIALILRGACTFELKLNNARQAGAVAAIVYAAGSSPAPIVMGVGGATLPAEMVSYTAGVEIKKALESQSDLVATLRFTEESVPVPANRLTVFSSLGPNVDTGIKPDLTAVGADVYVATQTLDSSGGMYDPSGYTLVDGTSFSTPLVAGAAALIRSARPGLTVDQYRSLLINTAAEARNTNGGVSGIQEAGAGLLDVQAALNARVTAYPVSLSFGAGGTDVELSRTLTITNVGTASEAFLIAAAPSADAAAPNIGTSTVELAPGAAIGIPISWSATGLAPGAYEGFVTVTGADSGTVIKIPYWYAATSGTPAHLTILESISSGRRGSPQSDAVLFRITDASGVPLTGVQPDISVTAGSGSVLGVHSYDSEIPGVFGIDVRLSQLRGVNVFRIQAGEVVKEISITGM